ncbi:glycosyltransferase [Haloarchaeobius sp. TZWWS8]|uniref:glycosyltransferase n=1 Tax=Haloarchaeobius sp. TZWWS8 TaxID=3446121 RepID=UPI003EBC20ED
MDPVVAVAHYPEGAGHATRMLAVAQALEAEGATVHLAGGGPGQKFVELQGYEEFVPAVVDYIGDYQDGGNLLRVITHSVPMSGKRVLDYALWLRRLEPDAIVTDDMFAAMAADLTDTPLHVLTHNSPHFYDAVVEEVFTWLLTRFQLRAGEQFLYPSVWPACDDDPVGVTHIPPIALEGTGEVEPEPMDALLVPSHYSDGFEALENRLTDDGHDVTLVGDGDWESVPSMLPFLEAADVVVCSGYSTVMEAAVAGTPCVIWPFTDEQHGVSRVIEKAGVAGFQVEHSIPHVARAVRNPPEEPEFENGDTAAAEYILEHL